MTSNLLVPLILIPTKINTKNDTLIDLKSKPIDFISNNLDPNEMSYYELKELILLCPQF